MSHYKPYPAYKDSGVEWFSRLPTQWEYSKIGLVAEVLAGYAFQADKFDSDGIAVVRMSDLKAGEVSFESIKKYPKADVPAKAHAKSGDLLVGLSGSISNFAIVKHSDLPLAVNQRVGVIRSNSCDGAYLTYFLRSYSYIQQILSQLPETTILNISMEQLRSARIPWPEKNVRDAVVRHLDQETARIDALISKKTRFIELLREKRQALITHAVTKGLDPSVKTKDSGVEWLGEVPEHWVVRPLKYVALLTTGITPPTDNPENYADEGFEWVGPDDLDESGTPVAASKFLSYEGKRFVRPVPRCSILICCIGTIGKVGFAGCEVSTNQQITAASFQYAGRYFFYVALAAKKGLEAAATGNVIQILFRWQSLT